MNRRMTALCVAVAIASCAFADAADKARRELVALRRTRQATMSPSERLADQVMRDVQAEQRRIARREVEIAPLYRTEAAQIYLDRERAAGRDPRQLERERSKQFAAVRQQLGVSDDPWAAETRLDRETNRLSGRLTGPRRMQLRRAERSAINGAEMLVIRERQSRNRLVRRVLDVAETLEREAPAESTLPSQGKKDKQAKTWLDRLFPFSDLFEGEGWRD